MPTEDPAVAELREKLREQRRKLREIERRTGAAYEAHRDDMAARSRERAERGREIGPLPDVEDPARRAACADDDERFLLTYFPNRFYLPFAEPHRNAIARIRRVTSVGGLAVVAMPRGFGKDAITEGLAIKALLYGRRRFVVVIQATERHAVKALRRLQRELEGNDLLAADFPEVCYPIRQLERINQRARGQHLGGVSTRIEFTAEGIILPTVEGSPSSGSAVQVYGLTGAIRGLTVVAPSGEPIRPDMVIINDAQTRDSAKSPTQTADREAIVSDDVLGLAGPRTTIAAVMLGTVIYPNDLTARFLDPERHPEWASVRTRLLLSFPEAMEMWDHYAELRRGGLREGDEGRTATEYYRDNREAMDKGARVSWPERFKAGELSGIQSALNFYIDNPRGFWAEGQNEPQAEALAQGAKQMNPKELVERLSGLDRLVVPRECSRLTVGVDLGLSLFWYVVAAWNEKGGGSIIDYGCYPRQGRAWFEARDARPGLGDVFPNMTEPQVVYAGLGAVVPELVGRTYPAEGGGEMAVNRALIDCGWQQEPVFQWIRQSTLAPLLYPSQGRGRTTSAAGVSEWHKKPGERTGYFWRLTVPQAGRVRMVQFDPDAWKSKIHELLTTPLGGESGLSLFGQRRKVDHEMLAAHLGAEYSTPVTIRGVTFDKWEVRPEGPDNHFLDCLVLAALAASVEGLVWSASGEPLPPPPARKTLGDYLDEAKRAKAADDARRAQERPGWRPHGR